MALAELGKYNDVSPSIPERNVIIRVKNGSTVIANKDAEIAGTTATIIDISTTSALESTVKKTTPTFDWEISYNDGTTWSSIGSSGPHTMYWTYAEPLSPAFTNEWSTTYPHLYDDALEYATEYADGSPDLNTIFGNLNAGVQSAITYDPKADDLIDVHPLQTYSSPKVGNCSDHAHLLRGLLRSVGIDGPLLYIWAGPNSTEATVFGLTSAPTDGVSFRIQKAAHEGAVQDPHFMYHSVVNRNNTWYDPSYGGDPYTSLAFTHVDISNPPQQKHGTKYTTPSFSGWYCPH
ncbi:MAG TPA: transglutaminase domain-containing protein [Pyrinomonadaceae bacterium]|nr:transglutaminase domain-containing protein [Pyrinomonadaceae bacterium]